MIKSIFEIDLPKNINITFSEDKKYFIVENLDTGLKKLNHISPLFLKDIYNHYYSGERYKNLGNQFKNLFVNSNSFYFIELEIIGLGYSVIKKNNILKFDLGFSHAIEYILPLGVHASIKENCLILYGYDKLLISQVASSILKFRRLNVYKGTGIKLKNKTIILKTGKKK